MIVRDLWSLRLQLLNDKFEASETDGEGIFSSQPISEETEPEDQRKRKWMSQATPSLIGTLAICYIAMILLRLPVSMGELHRYAVREDIPYIRAVRFVPAAMKKRLPAELLLALDTTFPLKPDHLRRAIHNTCLFYQVRFQLGIPPLNTPLLLYRHVRDLALPVHMFEAVGKIARILSVDFSFPQPRLRQRTSGLPEMALISLLIIAVKLYYPFSDVDFSVRSNTDPAILNVDWKAWLAIRQAHESHLKDPEHLNRGAEIDVTEKDVMAMTSTQLDDYLDWYERTWVDEERTQQKTQGLPTQLLQMFPTGRHDGSQPKTYDTNIEMEKDQASITRRLTETTSSVRVRKAMGNQSPSEEGEPPEIGSMYKRYRSIDELNSQALAFHEAAANAVAVKLETLLISVLQVERRLMVWREKQIKTEREDNAAEDRGDTEMLVSSEEDVDDNEDLRV